MKGKRCFLTAAALLLCLLLACWLWWGNTALTVTEYRLSGSVPEGFSGFRIAQVSDLHNGEFGKENEKLLELLAAARPDIIVITGDLVDSRNTDIPVALAFVSEAEKIAPCYYVTGNHEARISGFAQLEAGLVQAGVTVLRNASYTLERNGDSLTLLGVDDPSFETGYLTGDSRKVLLPKLAGLTEGAPGYTVLLSHRPELFDVYTEMGVDLVFSGHAHGGQIRLPVIGGLFAPNQGFFPKYDSGLYQNGDTVMAVSRGIGNSLIPLRVNNRPEVVVVELVGEQEVTE